MLRTSALLLTLLASCASDPPPNDPDAALRLESCRGEKTDAFASGDLHVIGDEIHVQVQTGGGCAPHTFSACWNGAVLDSNPPQAALELSHHAHGDTCDALLTHDVRIDLAPLRARNELPIVLHITGGSSQIAGTTNSVTFE